MKKNTGIKSTEVVRSYDFPNCTIRIYSDGRCREFPKWCLMISAERSRDYVAELLWMLRRYRRGEPIE